eukprot:158004_1
MGAEASRILEESRVVPPFSLSTSRYDLSTFTGRMLHFYSVNDPLTLLEGDSGVNRAREILQSYEKYGNTMKLSDEELWDTRNLVESAVHPDSQEIITAPLRFASFIPMNVLIISATLAPAVMRSFPLTAAAHFVNQSYNAGINFSNRNISSPVSTTQLLEGYAGAIALSMAFGLSATAMMRRAAVSGASRGTINLIRSTVPFLATTSAAIANVTLMRRTELNEGVEVHDEEGGLRGKSIVAGQDAVGKCAIARIIWNIPCMMLPAVLMSQVEKIPVIKRNPRVKAITELGILTGFLVVAISPALAIFPQKDSLPVDKLEPEFKNLVDSQNRPIKSLWFNKGL